MSDFAVLFSDRRPKFGAIAIDGSLSESHDHTARVTQYPIEFGADKSDHIQREPERVTIQGFVSNQPAKLGWQAMPDFDPVRHLTAWQQLLELFEQDVPFTLVTSLRVYSSMIFESLTADRSFESTNVLAFSASLRELETAFTTFAETQVAEEIADLAETAANVAMQGAIAADEASTASAVGAL